MRNNSEIVVFSMSSLLESRSDLLHLLAENKFSQKIHKLRRDALSHPALRNQE